MTPKLESKILHDIKSSFIDLLEPNFTFILNKYDKGIYLDLKNSLSNEFSLEDETELNYDFCLTLKISSSEEEAYLYVSFVGLYAFLVIEGQVVTQREAKTDLAKDICDILKQFKVEMLSKEDLLYTLGIDLSSFDDINENNFLLNILFTPSLCLD